MKRLLALLVVGFPLALVAAGCSKPVGKTAPSADQSKKVMEEMMAKTKGATADTLPKGPSR